MTPTELRERLIEGMARAMEVSAFVTCDAGYTCQNIQAERAFLNAEATVKRVRRKAERAFDAQAELLDAAGWQLVPKAMTEDMERAIFVLVKDGQGLTTRDAWAAAIAAAPSPFTAKEGA